MHGSRARRRFVAFLVFGGMLFAAVGLLMKTQDGVRPLSWFDGDSWTRPTRCLQCGGNLTRDDDVFMSCSNCGLLLSVPREVCEPLPGTDFP